MSWISLRWRNREAKPVNLCDVAHQVAGKFANQAARHGSRITVVAPARVLVAVQEHELRLVFTILISNAIKYGCGKSVRISVTPGPSRDLVVVRDHGRGFPLEEQAIYFGEHPPDGWDCCGLLIARRTVEAWGGVLSVAANPGFGSELRFEIPHHDSRREGF